MTKGTRSVRVGVRRTPPNPIVEISVAGFKSVSEEQRIEIRPLTILAGANSSGKSSIVQPVLLLKQTLDASYDAGPILLQGPNVKFSSADQVLSRMGKRHAADIFQVGIKLQSGESFVTSFRKDHGTGFQIDQMNTTGVRGSHTLWPKMSHQEILELGVLSEKDRTDEAPGGYGKGHWEVIRDRCFLELAFIAKGEDGTGFSGRQPLTFGTKSAIANVIHLPGLRGNPERTWPLTAVGPAYPGTFEKYTASVISEWMAGNEDILADLNADLKLLQLTGGVMAVRVNDVQIELHVGRLPEVPPTRPEDRVNIADAGVGVSQTLPVLVALRAAKPGALVYVEQPEIHLHPRAEFSLAQVLASAANRGIGLVVETHSSMLLLGVQTLVAEGTLAPDKVKLHWFERDKTGRTAVRPGDLDEAGRFGDWPEDFDDVALKRESRFLDAAEARLAKK